MTRSFSEGSNDDNNGKRATSKDRDQVTRSGVHGRPFSSKLERRSAGRGRSLWQFRAAGHAHFKATSPAEIFIIQVCSILFIYYLFLLVFFFWCCFLNNNNKTVLSITFNVKLPRYFVKLLLHENDHKILPH